MSIGNIDFRTRPACGAPARQRRRRIEREYGLGRGRTALLVLWPGEAGQPDDLWRRSVIECKVLRDSARRSMEATIERGIEQTLGEELERAGRRVAVWTL